MSRLNATSILLPPTLCFVLLSASPVARAELNTSPREQLIKYTSHNPFDRFPDGRPKVPDSVLEQLKELSAEDIYGVLTAKGYRNQFEGNWQILHPGRKLVGRAFTVQFMPVRPDVTEVDDAEAKAKSLTLAGNQRAIDQ